MISVANLQVETAVNVTFSVTATCHNIYLIAYNQIAAGSASSNS